MAKKGTKIYRLKDLYCTTKIPMILESINQCFGDYLTHVRTMSPLIPSPTAPPGAWSPRWGSWRATGHGGPRPRPRRRRWLRVHVPSTSIYHMGVFKNRGTPRSSILIGFSIINHLFWGTPIFGNTHISTLPSHAKVVFGDFLQQRIVGNGSRQTVYSRYLIISYVCLLIIYCMLLLQFSIPLNFQGRSGRLTVLT